MKVAIIGAGFGGLAAGVELVDQGIEVKVFEESKKPGGLAIGFLPKNWSWSLEVFYHHIFKNDRAIIELAERVGWSAFFREPVTKTFLGGVMAELDSPKALLMYGQLSVLGRLRMAMGLTILKMIFRPEWGKKLERYKVTEMLPKLVGREGYKKVWEPLMMAKFGKYVDRINMAWFWARIYKRTKSLGYFRGGFEKLAERMVSYVEKKGGEFEWGRKIEKIKRDDDDFVIGKERFDRVIVTTPAPVVNKLFGQEVIKMPKIDYLWGQTLVLEMNKSLMESYWLNVLERDWPFLVAVEHTRFMDQRCYGKKKIVYLGNYLEENDKRLGMGEKELLNLFTPYLKMINPEFQKAWVGRMWKFQLPFAQPVFPVDYGEKLEKVEVKIKGLEVVNMSMVYPWDRGTNYAVEFGQKVARKIIREAKDGPR